MSAERGSRKAILAVGAHPDDIEFGCGGVLLMEVERGSELHLLVGSRGEAGTNGTPEEREAEARSAADLLGATLRLADFGGDAQMRRTPENSNQVARTIRELKPDIVLAPGVHETQHPDHAVVGRMTRDACRLARYGGLEALKPAPPHAVESLYHYFISDLASNAGTGARVVVDVSSVVEKWKRLMETHQSQMRTRNYIELQLSKARALGLSAGTEYAIALLAEEPFVIDAISDLPRLGRAL